MPSNYCKLLAILLAIKAFEHNLRCKKVQVLFDNVAAVAYINHLGGPSVSLAALASAVWIRNWAFREAFGRKRKCPCQPPVLSVTALWMAASPTHVQVPRSHMGTSYIRSIILPVSQTEQPWFQTAGIISDRHYGCQTGHVCSCDQLTPQNRSTIPDGRSMLGTSLEGKIDHHGLGPLPTSQLSLHWAMSTLSLYNQQVNDFYSFCSSNGLPFALVDSSIITSYMCHVADKSPRPQSVLKTTRAALQHLYNALDQPSHLNCKEIMLLQSVLVKSGITMPMCRFAVMPIISFRQWFSLGNQMISYLLSSYVSSL